MCGGGAGWLWLSPEEGELGRPGEGRFVFSMGEVRSRGIGNRRRLWKVVVGGIMGAFFLS